MGEVESPAEVYERYLGRAIADPFTRVLLDCVGPKRGESVLDVAAGTGSGARRVAPMVGVEGRVVAVDNKCQRLDEQMPIRQGREPQLTQPRYPALGILVPPFPPEHTLAQIEDAPMLEPPAIIQPKRATFDSDGQTAPVCRGRKFGNRASSGAKDTSHERCRR